jgi:hypothetical protein
MSSRKANPRSPRDPRPQNATAVDRNVGRPGTRTTLPATKTRGRRQPQAEDFQVMSEMPEPLPISDKELRAIEILLGNELLDLLSSDTKDS